MHIGPYHLTSNVILAPMAGVTDLPFRHLCLRMGAGMAVSEMVSSSAQLWASEKTRRRTCHDQENLPRAIQIVGSDPARMAAAAQYNVDHGAQIIDINMGCPAKKVCNVAAGSALLRDESLVGRILDEVVAAVNVPVTLKIRTGWDPHHKNALRIAHIAQQAGVQALAIHGRSRACAFSGVAEYDTIAAVKAHTTIPIIANGDITSPQQAKHVLDYTKADAVMIGRAAQGWPWIFRETNHYLRTGTFLAPPSRDEIRDTLLEHLQNLYAFYGEYAGVRIARKHIGWYCKAQPQGALFRQRINVVEYADEQLAATRYFFDTMEHAATRVAA